jgi:hypothetical protein
MLLVSSARRPAASHATNARAHPAPRRYDSKTLSHTSQAAPTDPAEAAEFALSHAGVTQLSSLSVSLTQDLTRPELGPGQRRELLEVLAASLRHGQALSARVLVEGHWTVLTAFPRHRLLHSHRRLDDLLATDLLGWQVGEVLPPEVRAPVSMAAPGMGGIEPPFWPLGPLMWAVALAGARADLLPELSGQAAYRVSPGADLAGLHIPPTMRACIKRLTHQTTSLRELADWQGIGRERAMRLLNALYLQSALITTRSHPAATNAGWGGYGG